jgi:RNA polymerase sigma-70 factor (sigma-E family)
VADTREADFTEFVAERAHALLRTAYALTGDRHAAEDLVQTALAKAYARWRRIDDEPEPYVRRMIYNDFVSSWRRGRRRTEISMAEPPDRSGPVRLEHDTALRMLVRDALSALPPRQRAVLVLRYFEDLSVEETAAVLSCRQGTVASQANRALAKLRGMMTIEEMTVEMTAPAPTLAQDAMTQGRRLRHRRRTAVAAVAVAVVAMGIGVPFALKGSGPQTAAGPAAITEQPTALAGGWLATSVGPWYLDRSRQAYVRLEAGLLPAPTGDRVLGHDQDGAVELNTVTRTTPVRVNDARMRGDLAWSPDGDRLVGMINQKEPQDRTGFGVVDAATGAVTAHWIDHSAYNCSDCTWSWSRDGREVAVAIADRSRGEAMELVAWVQFFDAESGLPTRKVAIRAMPSSPYAWSPDGRYAIAADPINGTQLWDLTKGTARPFPYDAVWVADDLLLAADGHEVLTLRPDGTVVHRAGLGGAFQGLTGITLGPPE